MSFVIFCENNTLFFGVKSVLKPSLCLRIDLLKSKIIRAFQKRSLYSVVQDLSQVVPIYKCVVIIETTGLL